MWVDKLCSLMLSALMFKVCLWDPSVSPPAVLTCVQVVVFGVESSPFSRVSEADVTARLWLLYVIFMAVASRRHWGPEHVQLGEDRLPPPLVFSGDVCETSSNKLPISGEVGGIVHSFALEQILRWPAADPSLGLRPLSSLQVSVVGLALCFWHFGCIFSV